MYIKCNSNQKLNKDKRRYVNVRNIIYVKKIIFEIPLHVVAKLVNI